MSDTIKGLRNEFLKWKEAFESKGLKVNLGKTTTMINGGIPKDGMSKSKVVPCRVCILRVKVNLVSCVQCGKCNPSRCDDVKRVTKVFKKVYMQKM